MNWKSVFGVNPEKIQVINAQKEIDILNVRRMNAFFYICSCIAMRLLVKVKSYVNIQQNHASHDIFKSTYYLK